MPGIPKYFTLTDMAKSLGTPRHRVRFVVESYNIPHAVEIGEAHGWDRDAIAQVQVHLARIEKMKQLRI